jgi:hypothetical protein
MPPDIPHLPELYIHVISTKGGHVEHHLLPSLRFAGLSPTTSIGVSPLPQLPLPSTMTDPGDAPADPPVSSENVTMDIDSNPTPQPTDPSQSAPSDPVLATSEGITASSLTEPSSTQPQPTSEATPPSTEPATAPTSSSDVPPPAPSSDRREGEDEEDSPSELELYKAAHLKKEVDQEQAVSDALEKVSQLEKQLANERKRKDDGVSREDGLGVFCHLSSLMGHELAHRANIRDGRTSIQLNPFNTYRNRMPTFSSRFPPRRLKRLSIRPN